MPNFRRPLICSLLGLEFMSYILWSLLCMFAYVDTGIFCPCTAFFFSLTYVCISGRHI
jgi:hypothetical protein